MPSLVTLVESTRRAIGALARDTSGVSPGQYALIAAGIGVIVVIVIVFAGGDFKSLFTNVKAK